MKRKVAKKSRRRGPRGVSRGVSRPHTPIVEEQQQPVRRSLSLVYLFFVLALVVVGGYFLFRHWPTWLSTSTTSDSTSSSTTSTGNQSPSLLPIIGGSVVGVLVLVFLGVYLYRRRNTGWEDDVHPWDEYVNDEEDGEPYPETFEDFLSDSKYMPFDERKRLFNRLKIKYFNPFMVSFYLQKYEENPQKAIEDFDLDDEQVKVLKYQKGLDKWKPVDAYRGVFSINRKAIEDELAKSAGVGKTKRKSKWLGTWKKGTGKGKKVVVNKRRLFFLMNSVPKYIRDEIAKGASFEELQGRYGLRLWDMTRRDYNLIKEYGQEEKQAD